MDWTNLLESVPESVNNHLRLRHDYLVVENRILCNQIDGRIQLTDSEQSSRPCHWTAVTQITPPFEPSV